MKPKRIQRKRTRGWKMPANTIYVGRPTKWGNPFTLEIGRDKAIRLYKLWMTRKLTPASMKGIIETLLQKQGLAIFKLQIAGAVLAKYHIKELRDKNLACWCKLGDPCHADILLELANRPEVKP